MAKNNRKYKKVLWICVFNECIAAEYIHDFDRPYLILYLHGVLSHLKRFCSIAAHLQSYSDWHEGVCVL